MNEHIRSGLATKLLLATVVIIIVIVGLASFASRVVSNAGLLALARALVQDDLTGATRPNSTDLTNAYSWLETATRLDAANRGAWRGLGFVLANEGQEGDAIAAWRTAQATAAEFIWRGEIERVAGHFDKALAWYQRAISMQLEQSDGWYYAGLAFQGLNDWGSARRAYEQAIRVGTFDQISRSSLNYRLGVIYQQYTQPPLLDKALNAYSLALEQNDFLLESEAADCHYKRGMIYEPQDQRLALHEYEEAIALNPQHEWAHLRLGLMRYRIDKDMPAAEQEIGRALQLWPAGTSRKWPYRYLGDMYREAGLPAQAEVAYREALRWDPQDGQVKSSLAKLSQHD